MQNSKRFYLITLYLISVHVLTLLTLSLFRLIEFIFLHGNITQVGANPLTAFVNGVWFDNVIACYLIIVPLVVTLIAAGMGYDDKRWRRGVSIWMCVLNAIVFMASAANTPYFQYFFKNINSSIFEWFSYASTTAGMLLQEKSYLIHIGIYSVITAAYVYAMIRLRRMFDKKIEHTMKDNRSIGFTAVRVMMTLALAALCLLGIRGRTGYNPIKISEAYYCNDPFLNQLGINPAFNLLTSALDDMRPENRELHLVPYKSAITFTREALDITGPADSLNIMKREIKAAGKPVKRNVVIIMMESMTANLLHTFGQRQMLTPNLDSLYHHSLAFTNFYSAGIHTNHGLTAALYSFPALMYRNLMKGTVTPHRKGIPTVLKQEGYRNMFFMTHEAQYDNMKAFFMTNGYDEIFSQENYPKSQVVNSFGVSDHFLFDYALPVLSRHAATGKPFMATLLTISNHPPYIIPSFFKPKTADPETQIVEYADWAIGDFLRKASRMSWYKNTIFVIMADHGKMMGRNADELSPSFNHIPLIIFGPGVPACQCANLGMQVDVMPTLLSLLNMSYEYEGFGINLLKQKRQTVFYSADNQIVARDNSHCYIYEPKEQKSFCYTATPDWQLSPSRDKRAFAPLRRYVFSMIQTAEYVAQRETK